MRVDSAMSRLTMCAGGWCYALLQCAPDRESPSIASTAAVRRGPRRDSLERLEDVTVGPETVLSIIHTMLCSNALQSLLCPLVLQHPTPSPYHQPLSIISRFSSSAALCPSRATIFASSAFVVHLLQFRSLWCGACKPCGELC